MKFNRTFNLAMLAAAVLLAPLTGASASAQTTHGRIATANTSRIFSEIQESRDWQAKIQNDIAALEQEAQSRELKIKQAQSDRDQLKPESAQWGERNQEFTRLLIEHEVWKRLAQANLDRQQKQQMHQIFQKITEAVGQIAQQKEIDLVISEVRLEVPENLDQLQLNDLRNRLASRNVLYSGPTVDISSDVIAAMDARYKSGGR